MKQLVVGIFNKYEYAETAINELRDKGYGRDISLLSKKIEKGETKVKVDQKKQDLSSGTKTGAAIGGALGALYGLLGTAATITVPGIGAFLIVGPILTLLTATSGALTGGIVGALVDLGIPKKNAKYFGDQIMAGEFLVAVSTKEKLGEIEDILIAHGAKEVTWADIKK